MNQEQLLRASMMEQQAQALGERLQQVEQELRELVKLREALEGLMLSKEKRVLASLGKGVSFAADRVEEELFVEVGAGVVIKKKPEEVMEVIESQIERLSQAQEVISSRFDELMKILQTSFRHIEEQQKSR